MFATGARKLLHQPSDGSGLKVRTSGIDFMMADGITGAHPRMASLLLDGLGTKDTGIIRAMSSSMLMDTGGDSKVKNGSDMEEEYLSIQSHLEAKRFADHSTS